MFFRNQTCQNPAAKKNEKLLKWMIVLIGISLAPLQNTWAQAPDWQVRPSDYENSMNIIGLVFQADDPLTQTNALLAAFVDDKVRGVVKPAIISGQSVFFLTVYGDNDGEVLNFKIYDPSSDQVFLIQETSLFEKDGLQGAITAPFIFSTISPESRPDWQVEAANFENSMNVIGALYIDGVRARHPYDLIAALVGDEVRGVTAPMQVADEAVFFLTIYGDNEGENLTFQAYDTQTDQVYLIEQNLNFESDSQLGSLGEPFALNSQTGTNPPDWSVNAAAFEHSMNVIGRLYIDGISDANNLNLIAAFSGLEVRGVASPIEVSGQTLFFLTIFGANNGEALTFRAYDATGDRILQIVEGLTFEAGAIYGAIEQPFAWNSNAATGQPDWQVDASAFESSLSIIGSVSQDIISSPHTDDLVAAMVGSEVRGIASPTFVAGQTLFFLTVYGNVNNETISFQIYNRASGQIQTVSTVVSFQPDAVYGAIDHPIFWKLDLTPTGNNVVIQPEDAVTGTAPCSVNFSEVTQPGVTTLIVRDSGPPFPGGYQAVSPKAAYYEISTTALFSGMITLSINYEQPPVGGIDESDIQLWQFTNGTFTDITTTLNTDENIITGQASDLSVFAVVAPTPPTTLVQEKGAYKPERFSLRPNYPNPFNPETTISFLLPEAQYVRLTVLNILGQEIDVLMEGYMPAGEHIVNWSGENRFGENVSTGIYFYTLQSSNIQIVRKMTLSK